MRKIVLVLIVLAVGTGTMGCVAMNEMRYHPQTWYLLFAPYSAERTDNLIAKGYEAFEKGKYAKAYAIYENAALANVAKKTEGAPEAQLATDEYFRLPFATSLLNIRKYDEAARWFNSVLREDPDNERASAGLMLAQELGLKKAQQTSSTNDLLASLDMLSTSLQQLQPTSSQVAQASATPDTPLPSAVDWQGIYDHRVRGLQSAIGTYMQMSGNVRPAAALQTVRGWQRDLRDLRSQALSRDGVRIVASPLENWNP